MEKEHAMHKHMFAAMAVSGLALFGAAAWAEDSAGASTQGASQVAGSGSELMLEGSSAAAQGNVVGGSVAVPLGAASVAAGSASAGVGVVVDAAVAPIDAVFGDDPLPLTSATVVAQPAPAVPYAPGEDAGKLPPRS
jgi:hypothetical protein